MVLCGILAVIMAALQVAMSPLPNLEPVSLLVLVYTRVFGWQIFYILAVFILVEGLVFGFGLWWLSYLYVWPVWVLMVRMLSRKDTDRPAITWATASGAFGLGFGALCALPYLVGGPWAAVSYWIAGIPFDLMHCGGNFVLALVLANPLYQLLKQLKERIL